MGSFGNGRDTRNGLCINGYIDRLDLANDGRRALVRDYKTGKPPKETITLDGGKELQRCLYALAVKALLGDSVAVTPSLLYLRDEIELPLEDPDSALAELSTYLRLARASLNAGSSVIGPDGGDDYDELAFALPANAANTYCKRKRQAIADLLGEAALVWDAQ